MMIDLKYDWKLKTQDFGIIDNCNVPTSILFELLNRNLIKDPFIGVNEIEVREYLKKDYTYYKTFSLNNNDLKRHNYLFFESIDTVASIYINNHLIFDNYDMHERKRILLDNSILNLDNEIRIEFKSNLNYVESYDKEYQFLSLCESVLKSPVLRKAHYMFGWDWGPNLPDMGIYKDIYIESTDMGYLDSFRHKEEFNQNKCILTINASLVLNKKSKVKVRVSGHGYDKELCGDANENSNFKFEIDEPLLWYPNGYGNQNLYDVKIVLFDGIENKEYNYKIGLREIRIDDSLDEYGKKLTIYVNNIPIFLKGSDFIPMDNIIPRITKDKIFKLLLLTKEFNHNSIRVWGGGYYPDDYFYEVCDELGILVFQDLMFACALYDVNYKMFKDLIISETKDVLKRIRHHASIMLICGNNENETAIENWNPPRKEYAKEVYVKQYHDILGPIVKEYTDLYYLESSPTSGIERFKDSNDYNYMDMHYWDVWHGYKPFNAYKTIYPRLLSEFGCQSFTPFDTIKKYAKEEDFDIFSRVMMHHQKNRTCNDKILGYVNSMYNEPRNFESLVYLSMLSQAEGIKMCVEHLRCNKPRCHGVLYWQINDCWPGQSWSSIDYYFNLKALHYYSKKFYNESLIVIRKENDKIIFTISNDSLSDKKYKLVYKIIKNDGSVISTNESYVSVNKDSKDDVLLIDNIFNESNKHNTYIYASIYDGENKVSDNYYLDVYPKEFNLIKPNLEVEIIDEYTIKIKSDTYAKNIYIEPHIDGIVLSDNYFDLNKDEEKIIKFSKPYKLDNLDITSLFDYSK